MLGSLRSQVSLVFFVLIFPFDLFLPFFILFYFILNSIFIFTTPYFLIASFGFISIINFQEVYSSNSRSHLVPTSPALLYQSTLRRFFTSSAVSDYLHLSASFQQLHHLRLPLWLPIYLPPLSPPHPHLASLLSYPPSTHRQHYFPPILSYRMARGPSSEQSSTTTTLSANPLISVLNSPTASSSPSPEPSTSTMVGRKNTMRSPQADISASVTYTPTTHRISKAKKGKRVHACEFPGCTKV